MKTKVVYGWFDDSECFYVGIGNKDRPYSKKNRNRFCINKRNKAEKNNSFNIQIFATGLSLDQACELECKLIKQYGRRDLGTGCLTNLTDGGEGTTGHRHTEEYKRRHSINQKGKTLSDQHKRKISKANKGKRRSPESKKRMSESAKARGINGRHIQPVRTPFGDFTTMKDAANDLPFSYSTLWRRVKDKNNLGYYYL